MKSKSDLKKSVKITLESNNRFKALKISKEKLLKIRGGDDPPRNEEPIKPPKL